MVTVKLSEKTSTALAACTGEPGEYARQWLQLVIERPPSATHKVGIGQTELHASYVSSNGAGKGADFDAWVLVQIAIALFDDSAGGSAGKSGGYAVRQVRWKPSLSECLLCSASSGSRFLLETPRVLSLHMEAFHSGLSSNLVKLATDYCRRWNVHGLEPWLVRCSTAKDPRLHVGQEGKDFLVHIAGDTIPLPEHTPFPSMDEVSLVQLFRLALEARSKLENKDLFIRLGCTTIEQCTKSVEKHFAVFYEIAYYAKKADEEGSARKRAATAEAIASPNDTKRLRLDS